MILVYEIPELVLQHLVVLPPSFSSPSSPSPAQVWNLSHTYFIRVVSKFFSRFFSLSRSLFTASTKSGKFPDAFFALNHAISKPIDQNKLKNCNSHPHYLLKTSSNFRSQKNHRTAQPTLAFSI